MNLNSQLRFGLKAFAFLQICFLSSATVHPAAAEDIVINTNDEIAARSMALPKLPPQVVEKIAAQFGVPKTSRFYKNFTHLSNDKFGSKEFISDNLKIKFQDNKVIAHLRSDKGIPFPTQDKYQAMDQKLKNIKLPAPNVSMLTEQKKAFAKMIAMNKTVPIIPDCREDSSKRTVNTASREGFNKNQTIFDMLFIKKEDVPLDTDEVFGKSTKIMDIEPGKRSMAAFSAGTLRVPCLPYRIRATNDYFYRDSGLNALKNYDEDQNGVGVLHEIARIKYKGF